MDLPEILKKKIIDDVFRSHHDAEWSLLIYDSHAAAIMKNIFVKSEFINHSIVISQRIEEQRTPVDFPVIYFVRGEEDIANVINKDFESKMYSSFVVYTLERCEWLNPLIKTKIVDIDFVAVEQRVFRCTPDQLYSVGKTLNSMFNVSYSGYVCKKSAEIFDEASQNDSRRGEMIILDRSVDLFSPFMHFFTFRTLLEDLEVEEVDVFSQEYMRDRIWESVRGVHLGEVNETLRHHAHLLSKIAQKLDTKVDSKELMKMVLDAPAASKTKESLSKLIRMAQKCYNKFDYLSKFVGIEQQLSTGYESDGTKWKMKVDEVFKYLCNRRIEKPDRVRILILLKANGYRLQENEKEMLKHAGFTSKEIELEFKNQELFVPLKEKIDHRYEVSRYEPVLSNVLRSFIEKKQGHVDITCLTHSRAHLKSLRKSYLLSVKKDVLHKKVYCVYIIGGMTFEEIRVVYELSEILGVEIIIGSDKIIVPRSYTEDLTKD
ncbi:Sec1-like intracellular trafficking protein [Ordospora colligata]|uniref:Sec1-like intracellular trafficking protein n=1 Tax=Ordospora colligata OC4 TaxID=1354746 RepID=A0A0B2ULS5_9MICR|nr:Sec1-like intracellular trafficking protein [Ordospora colligata OC4]KHN70214.1 Sec1-like intracellular trafficking protein [Ordospora colligata OC4]TBU16758.1 Sec1-like intracellular trafficking protein [Ordospora colligata]TBU17064.1 Sec1-like intracellular trafficking protein [Ordospora colligata]TBU19307.1 Sec1-like intracellular trafficking protein [Ordospora colligata]